MPDLHVPDAVRHPTRAIRPVDERDVPLDELLEPAGEQQPEILPGPAGEHERDVGAATLALGLGLVAFLAIWAVLLLLPDQSPARRSSLAEATPTRASNDAGRASAGASASPSASAAPSGSASAAATPGPLTGATYAGAVRSVGATVASATCEDGPSRDGTGATVTFEPSRALDGDPSTAWRCEGDGLGEELVIRLDGTGPVAEVGLVPGWATTDAGNGNDRYALNRRVAKARWTFDGGAYVDQELSTDRASRNLQTLRLPPVETGTVTLRILATEQGERDDATAVSEVRISEPAG